MIETSSTVRPVARVRRYRYDGGPENWVAPARTLLFGNGGASNFCYWAGATVTAPPFTVACWHYHTSAVNGTIMSLYASTGSNVFGLQYINATGTVGAFSWDSSALSQAQSTTGFANNRWGHMCGVWRGAADRSAYLNGGSRGNETTSRSVTGINRVEVGSYAFSTRAGYLPGHIALLGVWNVALTDDEIKYLASPSVVPTMVRPNSLVHYWPFGANYGFADYRDWAGAGNIGPLSDSGALPSISCANPPPLIPGIKRSRVPVIANPTGGPFPFHLRASQSGGMGWRC